jgi:DNA phosphorothioation-dependent restriction protein DptG
MISGNLEYLMSSLPELAFPATKAGRQQVYALLRSYAATAEEGEVFPVQILDEEAAKFLSKRDLDLLQAVQLDRIYEPTYQASRCRLLAHFARFDEQLRRKVSELRQQRRNGTKDSPAPSTDWLESGDPLQEEQQLQQLRWNQVEELASGHYADLDALVAYKLKLLILRRQWSFDARRGTKLFRELTKANGL